ncbi:MAG: hypothetical protein LCH59_06635 [Proteobacteria bacterium]|nr:hypothetical protein [Pseudomonadota bacterium]
MAKIPSLDRPGPLLPWWMTAIVTGQSTNARLPLSHLGMLPRGGIALSLAAYAADTASTADADPGSAKLRWDHATQASATNLFMSDVDDDSEDHSALWPTLDVGAHLYLHNPDDLDVWQWWSITSVTYSSGYVKLAVTLTGSAGSFGDGDPVVVTVQQPESGGGVDSVNGQTGAVSLALDYLSDVDASAPTDGHALTWNSSAGKWEPTAPSGGGGSPGGSSGQVQYNDAGAFGGDSAFRFDPATKALSAPVMDFGKGTDIARAATTPIGVATGNFVHLTGTTTVTSFGTGTAGQIRYIRFGGAGTLTHNAASLILPAGANITTAANDCCIAVCEGGSNWRVIAYELANGQPIGAASITGWTPSTNTSSPNNTAHAARMLAASASTNVDAVIQPKGSGALMAQLPTASATGGDKRGTYAVDWQMQRDNANDVASGYNSSLGGGYGNRSGAPYAVVGGGLYCRITAGDCSVIAGGSSNTSSYSNTAIGGGSSNSITGQGSVISGGVTGNISEQYAAITGGNQVSLSGRYSRGGGNGASDRGVWGADVFASASMRGSGDFQKGGYTLGVVTSDSSATRATTTSSGPPSTTNQVTLPDNGAYRLKGHAIARRASNGDTKSWDLAVTIKRGANAAATAIVGTATVTPVDADPGASAWTIGLTADTTDGCLAVTATGQSGATIKWSIRLDSIEVVG